MPTLSLRPALMGGASLAVIAVALVLVEIGSPFKSMDVLFEETDPARPIPQLKDETAPTQEARDSQLLFNEPKYIRMDEDGIHTLESAGLKMKSGVYY